MNEVEFQIRCEIDGNMCTSILSLPRNKHIFKHLLETKEGRESLRQVVAVNLAEMMEYLLCYLNNEDQK